MRNLKSTKPEYKKITGFDVMEWFPVVEFKYAANRIFHWINTNTDTFSMYEVVKIINTTTKYDDTLGMIVDFSDESELPLNERNYKVRTNDGEYVDINHKNFTNTDRMEVRSALKYPRDRRTIWNTYDDTLNKPSRWGYDYNRIWNKI